MYRSNMSRRINYSSGSKWEDIVGYSRAVKIGNVVEVTGTVASGDDGNVVGKNDAYAQTKFIYQKIESVLQRAGAEMKDVIRVRMFVTDISRWQEYGKAHSEFFKEIKPCNTMVEVSALIEPDYLIEIEATAVIEE
jgi:enamine deaminase RidA (YjgF/YER057c/UK114 family)